MARIAFNPPPNWPVERGWTPPPDWRPDPAWGMAPPGWVFWVELPPVEDQQAPEGKLQATKQRVDSLTKRVKSAAERAATSDRTKDLASKAKDVATDERTIAALKVAGAMALGAAVSKHYRGKGQAVPDSVDQIVTAAKNSSLAGPGKKDHGSTKLVASDPFELRLGWSTVGTLLKHPDHPKLWLESSMPGIQHYALAVEWGENLRRTLIEIGDVPKQWTRMQVGKTVLPVALCRTSEDTITFVWLTEPYDQQEELARAFDSPALIAGGDTLLLSCPCGQELHGSDHETLYAAASAHAREAHQMSASRAAVMAAATKVGPSQASHSGSEARDRTPPPDAGTTDPAEIKRQRELQARKHAAEREADYQKQMQDAQDAARHAQFLSNLTSLQHQTSMSIIRNIR